MWQPRYFVGQISSVVCDSRLGRTNVFVQVALKLETAEIGAVNLAIDGAAEISDGLVASQFSSFGPLRTRQPFARTRRQRFIGLFERCTATPNISYLALGRLYR